MKPSALLIAVVSTLTLASTSWAAPELSVDHGSFSFGTITQGKKVQHNFQIKNSGDQPLQIKQLIASCGCTAATPSSTLIAPGKSAEIKVIFDSANFTGKVSKTVAMTTNAAKGPNYTFVMEGTILEEIQVAPRQLSLGPMKPGVAKEVKLTVANHGTKSLRLLSANANSKSLQIKPVLHKTEIKPGESATIDVVITPKMDVKVLSGYLHLVTDHPQKKEITIPIYGSLGK